MRGTYDRKLRTHAARGALGMMISLLALAAGCSSGGYVEGMDLPAVVDAAKPTDGGTSDGAAPDLSTPDLAVVPNSWTFFGSTFVGREPTCFPVMNWWAVTTSAVAPYYCSIDVFFQSRPTRDGVYQMSTKNATMLGPSDVNVIITDQRTGGVEQWHPQASGQVLVRVNGSMLTITLDKTLLRGAVSVPAGTPDQEVNGTFLCP